MHERGYVDAVKAVAEGGQPLSDVADYTEARDAVGFRHPDGVLVSALTGEGIDALREAIAADFERRLVDVDLLVPFSEGATLHELHELAGDLEREDTPEGVRVAVRLPEPVAARFDRGTSSRKPRS